jgi:two-component system sensor histidine kinase KdpD
VGNRKLDLRRIALLVVGVVAPLLVVTAVIEVLESRLGIQDGSAVYLLSVVTVAVLFGTTPAILSALGAFALYDFLFIEPHFSLTVHDSREWVNLLLLLFIGTVVGRLAGEQRDRAERAMAREREARALFKVSFSLSDRRDTSAALASVVATVREETRMSRVWVVIGETVLGDTGAGVGPAPAPSVHLSLRRRPGDEPAAWVRVHAPGRGQVAVRDPEETAYRIAIAIGDRAFGSLWGMRPRTLGDPDRGETRVLAATADQLAGSLERDRLARDATSAEVSRRSDALKSALLDSVSHDLRTPLASIRAAAGTLMDPEVEWPDEQRHVIAASIDREAEWLNRLVTNLLDMSRIEAGELKPSLGLFELQDLVDQAVARSMTGARDPRLTVDLPGDLPPVLVDEVFLGQILVNLLDNAAKYAGSAAPISVSARSTGLGRVLLTVEDGGAGVPPEVLPRLFEKFYRVPRPGEGSRRGTGIGLSVVEGLVLAMDGHVTARTSDLGGLAIDVDLPADQAGSRA